MGIGSGIIYESDAEDEYQECLLKADFLTNLNQDFYLIESFRLDADKNEFINLEQHLQRLTKSADSFGFKVNREMIEEELNKIKKSLSLGVHKIRLTTFQNGEVKITHSAIEKDDGTPKKITISDTRIDSTSIFQHHKTSRRELYNQAYNKAAKEGFYDVLFFNENDQLVEASRHNIFIKKNNQYHTPPLLQGALGGIQRQAFMREYDIKETSLTRIDLENADEILLTNSVRGAVTVMI